MNDKTKLKVIALKIEKLAELLKETDLHPKMIHDLAAPIVQYAMQDYTGACRVVEAIDEPGIARLLIAVLDKKTSVGEKPTNKNFSGVLKVTHGKGVDERLSEPATVYHNTYHEMSWMQRCEALCHMKLNIVASDELKAFLVSKRLTESAQQQGEDFGDQRDVMKFLSKTNKRFKDFGELLEGKDELTKNRRSE